MMLSAMVQLAAVLACLLVLVVVAAVLLVLYVWCWLVLVVVFGGYNNFGVFLRCFRM